MSWRAVLLAVLLLAVAGPARARAGDWTWTPTQAGLELGALALLAVDASQTFAIQRAGVYDEANPVLGRHPTDLAIGLYFGAWIVGHAAVAAALPSPWREVWSVAAIAIEGTVVTSNRFAWGVGLAVPW